MAYFFCMNKTTIFSRNIVTQIEKKSHDVDFNRTSMKIHVHDLFPKKYGKF